MRYWVVSGKWGRLTHASFSGDIPFSLSPTETLCGVCLKVGWVFSPLATPNCPRCLTKIQQLEADR